MELGLEDLFNALSLVHILSSATADKIVWRPSSNGKFSISSAFHLQVSFVGPVPFWSNLRSSKLIPKVNIFFWLFFQNKV